MIHSVLVVEDEPDIRELVGYNLSKQGHRVRTVESGEDALAVLQLQSFDLTLLDRMLPGVDGLTVCRELRSNAETRSVPIIMLTALGDICSQLQDEHLGDEVHPNEAGAKIIAEAVFKVLCIVHEAGWTD